MPSNTARLHNGAIEFVGGYTQNKPKYIVAPVEEAAQRLLAGERVVVDMRYAYMQQLRALVGIAQSC